MRSYSGGCLFTFEQCLFVFLQWVECLFTIHQCLNQTGMATSDITLVSQLALRLAVLFDVLSDRLERSQLSPEMYSVLSRVCSDHNEVLETQFLRSELVTRQADIVSRVEQAATNRSGASSRRQKSQRSLSKQTSSLQSVSLSGRSTGFEKASLRSSFASTQPGNALARITESKDGEDNLGKETTLQMVVESKEVRAPSSMATASQSSSKALVLHSSAATSPGAVPPSNVNQTSPEEAKDTLSSGNLTETIPASVSRNDVLLLAHRVVKETLSVIHRVSDLESHHTVNADNTAWWKVSVRLSVCKICKFMRHQSSLCLLPIISLSKHCHS